MNRILVILLASILLISCDKNEPSSPSVDPNPITVVSAAPCYGVMVNARLYQIIDGIITGPFGESEANFSNTTFTNETNLPVVYSAGQVSLNNITFKKQGVSAPSYTYYDSTHRIYTNPYIWRVEGGEYTPPIYFSNTDGFPVFTDYSLIPDTVHRNNGDLNLTFPNLSHVNEISTRLNGHLRTIDYTQTNTITYDSAYVSNAIGNDVTISVRFKMCKYIMVEGKIYKLINLLEVVKYNVKFIN